MPRILGVMDADLQHPPELLPALIAAIQAGNDLAIGSRYTAGGQLGNWNPVRKFLSTAAVWATWPIQRSGVRAKDPMTGFFLLRRECIDGIKFQPSGFKLLLGDSRPRTPPLGQGTSVGLRSALAAPAKPTSKSAGITPSCWPGSTLQESAWAAAPDSRSSAFQRDAMAASVASSTSSVRFRAASRKRRIA